jgi:hypothetical protein
MIFDIVSKVKIVLGELDLQSRDKDGKNISRVKDSMHFPAQRCMMAD